MIKLEEGQLAMWHPHDLTFEEIYFIITNMDAVKFINEQENFYKRNFNKDDEKKFKFLKNDLKILQKLNLKLEIWTK